MYTLQDASLILVDQSEMKILCSDQKWFEWSYFTRSFLKLYVSSSKNRVSSLKFSFFADLFKRLMNFSYRLSPESNLSSSSSSPSQTSKSGRNCGGNLRLIDSNRDPKGYGIARFQLFLGGLDRFESRLESIDRRDRIPTENPVPVFSVLLIAARNSKESITYECISL